MHWSMITTILTLVNHVYADPATLDPLVLANLEFDQIDGDIGFIKVLSCTESQSESTFTYPLGISEMAALEPYVISMKIIPEDKPVESIIIGIDDYAVQTVTCSNPVISITKSIDPSWTRDYPVWTHVSRANLNDYLGSVGAKSRLNAGHTCFPNDPLRSIRDFHYDAWCNNGIYIHSDDNRCVWEFDHDVIIGDSIAIYYGFDVNKQKVCAESGGLGPGDGSFYNLNPCPDVTCPDTGNLCTQNVCIDGFCVTTNTIICGFGEVCNDVNGECETDCDIFDIDKYTETCSVNSVNDIVGRIEALENTENNSTLQLQGDIGTLKTENTRLQNEIITLQGEIDTLMIENSALQGEIDTLKTENLGLQDEIDILKTEDSALQDGIDTLKMENSALQGEIDTLQTENSGLKDDIFTLNATIKAINDRIDNLVIQQQPPPPPPPPHPFRI